MMVFIKECIKIWCMWAIGSILVSIGIYILGAIACFVLALIGEATNG